LISFSLQEQARGLLTAPCRYGKARALLIPLGGGPIKRAYFRPAPVPGKT